MESTKPIIYLVGGAVRDRLLGLRAHENDFVVVGSTPEQLIQQGFTPVGKDFPVFLHPKTHEEYALARTERKSGQGYHGFVCAFSPEVTLEEDLIRRDLTINAIAEDQNGTLIDPYDGQDDLKRRLLRHVSPAFVEDPLRILRVARFAAKLPGFNVARETMDLMKHMVGNKELSHLPKERIWKETKRALSASEPWRYFEVLIEAQAWQQYCSVPAPDLAQYKSLCQKTSDAAERLAGWLCCSGEDKTIKHTLKQLGCDRKTAELVQLCGYLTETMKHPPASAEELLGVFMKADGFRRIERWKSAAKVVEHTHQLPSQKWSTWLTQLKELDLSDLIESKPSGRALGEAIYDRRLKTLSGFLGQ